MVTMVWVDSRLRLGPHLHIHITTHIASWAPYHYRHNHEVH